MSTLRPKLGETEAKWVFVLAGFLGGVGGCILARDAVWWVQSLVALAFVWGALGAYWLFRVLRHRRIAAQPARVAVRVPRS